LVDFVVADCAQVVEFVADFVARIAKFKFVTDVTAPPERELSAIDLKFSICFISANVRDYSVEV
jgi:hypothetical protein